MAWIMWCIAASFYTFQFFLRSSPNAMSTHLMQTFEVGAPLLGLFTAAYYWTYASLQIPVGILLDIWGPKKMLRWGSLLCAIGVLLFACSQSFFLAVGARCIIGAGAAAVFIGSVKLNTLWFPPAQLAFVIGLLSSSGKIGGATANALLPTMIAYAPSWRFMLIGLGILGCALSGIIWLFVKNGPQDTMPSLLDKKLSWKKQMKQLHKECFAVMKTPFIWYIGLYGYAMYLTLSVFSDTYSISFLKALLGTSDGLAGRLSALVPIGSCFGASFISYLSDHFQRRIIFLRVSVFLTLFFSGLVFFAGLSSILWLSVCLFGFGFFSGAQVLVFVTATENVPSRLSGMAVGTVNAILMLGGSFHNPLVGGLLKLFWDGSFEKGVPIYSLKTFQWAFSSIFLFFILGLFLTFLLKETHPSRRKNSSIQ